MEGVNLPNEIAREPEESARLSQGDIRTPSMEIARKKCVTFEENTQYTENSASQTSSTSKDMLSQPAPGLTHRQRLQWLQKRRSAGLWVQCDSCDRWRHIPNVIDCHDLPDKWTCSMNPDKGKASCSIPEAPLRLRDEEDLIHGEYSAGSVVWARMGGWPWWPAMVDDDPDTEQYYWLDGFSDIPTHYNVTYFDSAPVSRSWVSPNNLKPFGPYKKSFRNLPRDKNTRKRMEAALSQAEDAERLALAKRLTKYSFIARYTGSVNEPKKVTKKELQKFGNKLKRKFNVEFSDEDENSQDEGNAVVQPKKQNSTTVIKKGTNVFLVGSSKKSLNKKTKVNKKPEVKERRTRQDSLLGNDSVYATTESSAQLNTATTSEKDSDSVQPNSMAVQMDSCEPSTIEDKTLDINDNTVTQIEDSNDLEEGRIRKRAVSPKSDDFDF